MAGLMHEIEEDIATTDNQRPSAHIQSNGFHSWLFVQPIYSKK